MQSNESLTQLVSGIVGDAQTLMKQNLTLFRLEVKEDMRKTVAAMSSLAIGGVLLLIAGIVLSLMLVHLVDAMTDDSILSLWACYGLVGVGIAVIGGVLFAAGMWRFQSFNPLPDESARALQENVRWMTNSK